MPSSGIARGRRMPAVLAGAFLVHPQIAQIMKKILFLLHRRHRRYLRM
jgi:hypothetical protein